MRFHLMMHHHISNKTIRNIKVRFAMLILLLKSQNCRVTLEFQIEGDGEINGWLANYGQSNKRGGWQKHSN